MITNKRTDDMSAIERMHTEVYLDGEKLEGVVQALSVLEGDEPQLGGWVQVHVLKKVVVVGQPTPVNRAGYKHVSGIVEFKDGFRACAGACGFLECIQKGT